MYTVIFKSWSSNWSEYETPEEYTSLKEAIERAEDMYSLETRSIGSNLYVNDGMETWVEDHNGNRLDITSIKYNHLISIGFTDFEIGRGITQREIEERELKIQNP